VVQARIRVKGETFPQRKELMVLKITRVGSLDQEITLQLDGRVTGPWVELLRQYAEPVLAEGARLTLNLQNVYFIDCEGVGLIKSLMDREVQVNAPFFVAEPPQSLSSPVIFGSLSFRDAFRPLPGVRSNDGTPGSCYSPH
jgi:anti-anti-sigma regulatory factor